ncbi:MAG: oligosaccharide repeat unit polymerase [Thermaerobacter sp.]|nr:oligosaccharide repeat unit polymerase [Thermaerobacter sp.]
MIFFSVVMVAIFLLIVIYLRLRTLNTPVVYYIVWWCAWTLISQFNFMGLYHVSATTYAAVTLKVSMFTAGYLAVSRKTTSTSVQPVSVQRSLSLSKHVLWFQWVLLAILVFYLRRYYSVIAQLTVWDLRNARFDVGGLFSSGIEAMIYNYFVTAWVYFFLLMVISEYLITRRLRPVGVLSIANVVLYSLIGYGRLVYFDAGIFLAVGGLLFARQYRGTTLLKSPRAHSTRYRGLIVYAVGIVGGIAMSGYLTASRLGHVDWFTGILVMLEQGLIYFTGPFRALDVYFFAYADQLTFQLGRATFAGLDEPLSLVLRLLGLDIVPNNFLVGPITREPIRIGFGDNASFNAFYTSILNYHMDFGLAGIAVFSFLYGVAVSTAYNRFVRYPNTLSLMLVLFMVQTSIFSLLRWSFQNPSSWIILVMIGLARYFHSDRLPWLEKHNNRRL